MAKFPKIKSDFALLDVKTGRYALKRYLKANGPQKVIVEMTLLYDAGSDDGTSIEFAADVTKLTIEAE